MGIKISIDITPNLRKIILSLLNRHIPGVSVWAYGSRLKWTSSPESDLDLIVFSSPEQRSRISAIKEAFEESSLPFRIDVLVWDEIPDDFRQNILENYVVLVEKPGVKPDSPTRGSGWHTLLLEELTINYDGKRKPVKKADRKPGPYPYFGASGVVDYVEGYIFDGEYLLIAEDGENLRTRQTPITFMAKGKFWVNNHAHIVTGNDKADTHFLMYALQHADVNSFITGAVMPKLNQENLNKIPINFPPLEAQRAIAQILGVLDDKIKLNHQINQTLEQMAQAIFKSWFVNFEPVKAKMKAKEELRSKNSELKRKNPQFILRSAMCAISGKTGAELDQLPTKEYKQLAVTAALFPDELVKSELGEIPRGWEWKPLHETAEYVNGAAFKAKDFSGSNEGLPIIKIAELKEGITSQTKFTTGSFKGKYLVNDGDILYSWSGSPETSLDVFKWFSGQGWLNQHIFKLNFDLKEQKYFTYFLLKHMKPILVQTAKDKQTTGLGHVTVADMKRFKVVSPYKKILLEFARKIGSIYEQVSSLQQQLTSLAHIRDSLLPKLLSGEINLSRSKAGWDSNQKGLEAGL